MSVKKRSWLWGWLPLAAAVTVLSVGMFGIGQQVLRQTANDPQIQLATDAARALDQGADPKSVVGSTIDVAVSLAPGLIIYDHNGRLLASSIQENGQSPSIPTGVIDQAKSHGLDWVTWQTASGTRLAAVAAASGSPGGDVVVAARSLKQVEAREEDVRRIALICWLAALGSSLVIAYWAAKRTS